MPYLMGAPFLGSRAGAAFALDGLTVFLPKTGLTEPFHDAWTTIAGDSHAVVMGGNPGVVYDVTLRITGEVELRYYAGGSNNGLLHLLGTHGGAWNHYNLHITSPTIEDPDNMGFFVEQDWYLNRAPDGIVDGVAPAAPIDYQATFAIEAGATVSLAGSSNDGVEAMGASLNGVDGQWIRIEVIGVSPQ